MTTSGSLDSASRTTGIAPAVAAILVVALTAAACSSGAPPSRSRRPQPTPVAVVPPEGTPPDPSSPDVTPPPPPDAGPIASPDAAPPVATGPCAVEVTFATLGTGNTRMVAARMKNLSNAPVDLELPDRCPDGPLEFTGIRPGYDFYTTCSMNLACPVRDQRAPLRVHLEPGQITQVATTKLELAGNACNQPLPAGRYTIAAVIPPLPVVSCVTPTTFEIGAPQTDVRACTSDADCTIHCPSAPGCSSSAPCGCKSAINKARIADVDRLFATSCTKGRCPAVGCRHDEAMGARCDAGRCVAW